MNQQTTSPNFNEDTIMHLAHSRPDESYEYGQTREETAIKRVTNGVKTQWIDEDWIPEKPKYKNAWRYWICRNSERLFEFKDTKEKSGMDLLLEQLHIFQELGETDLYIETYTPTLEEVCAIEREHRARRNFENCY